MTLIMTFLRLPIKLSMIADDSRDLIPEKGSASLSYLSTGRSMMLSIPCNELSSIKSFAETVTV